MTLEGTSEAYYNNMTRALQPPEMAWWAAAVQDTLRPSNSLARRSRDIEMYVNNDALALLPDFFDILVSPLKFLTKLRLWLRRTRARLARGVIHTFKFKNFQRQLVQLLGANVPTRNLAYFLSKRAGRSSAIPLPASSIDYFNAMF